MTTALQDELLASLQEVITVPRLDHFIPVTVHAGGVTLHIDRGAGLHYIETDIEHDSFARTALIERARAGGFDLDDPYYDEQQATGRLRSYLLEVETD